MLGGNPRSRAAELSTWPVSTLYDYAEGDKCGSTSMISPFDFCSLFIHCSNGASIAEERASELPSESRHTSELLEQRLVVRLNNGREPHLATEIISGLCPNFIARQTHIRWLSTWASHCVLANSVHLYSTTYHFTMTAFWRLNFFVQAWGNSVLNSVFFLCMAFKSRSDYNKKCNLQS